ncbi:DUF2975 domain-containing protein [Caulobacter sp.]|uniref:DUF2975 domain-containing protein n=1 Tax=Caulobacter sp. TaxID=78 RepID=UPI001B009643|nr:DUF2975 domain-containing protein [Caulobacter sp.]MBO9544132.1 DUF2975 domain-containing protein [Caulobacter sp.]
MATVLHLKPLYRAPPAPQESPAQRRVRLGSRAAVWLFTSVFALAAAILVAAIATMLFYKGELVRIGPDNCYIGEAPANTVAFSSLPLGHRLVYVAVGIARATPILMMFWSLRALFAGYARGEVFSAQAARRFGRVGAWLCAYAVSPFLCHVVLAATHYEIDKNWAHMASLQAFILGLLVFVIGQVMQVGREIEQDREAFV